VTKKSFKLKGTMKTSLLASRLRFRQITTGNNSANSPRKVDESRTSPSKHSLLSQIKKTTSNDDETFDEIAVSAAPQLIISKRRLRKKTSEPPFSKKVVFYINGTIYLNVLLMLMVLIWFALHNDSSGKEAISVTKSASTRKSASGGSILEEKMSNNSGIKQMHGKSPALIQQQEPMGLTKPYHSITYHDLNFALHSTGAPSCQDPLEIKDISFTLVTQVSEDRLWLITQHCQRWAPGRISVAVFTNQTVETMWKEFSIHETRYGRCLPDQLSISVLPSENYGRDNYPVNKLRNLALQQVKTSHIMYVDSDFFVSPNLLSVLNNDTIREKFARDARLALVVPALQIPQKCEKKTEHDCRVENIQRMPHDVDELMAMVRQRQATAFDPSNRGGHGSTSYMQWARMNAGDLRDIPCILSNRYEPYLAARYCRDFPPYQEAFTGYGKNKMTQIMQMRHTGYVFLQLGGVFLCHYPHPPAASLETWKDGIEVRKLWLSNRTAAEETFGPIDWTKYKRGQVDKIFIEFKKWLKHEVPEHARTPKATSKFNDDVKLWLNDQDAPSSTQELLLHPLSEHSSCN